MTTDSISQRAVRFARARLAGEYSTDALAANAGLVNASALSDAKFIIAEGDPTVAAAVEKGRLTLYAACRIVNEVGRADQAEVVVRVLTRLNAGDQHAISHELGDDGRAQPRRRAAAVVARIVTACANSTAAVRLLLEKPTLPAALAPEDAARFAQELDRVIRPLVRLRKRLREATGGPAS